MKKKKSRKEKLLSELEKMLSSSGEIKNYPRVSTGIEGFDAGLEGGFLQGALNIVYGLPGVGKTTFLIHFAVEQIIKGKHVFVMDTEGGWSGDRVKRILSRRISELDNPDEVIKTIKKIRPLHVWRVTSRTEAKKCIELWDLIRERNLNVGAFIIDSISALYVPDLMAASHERLAMTARELGGFGAVMGIKMHRLAEAYNCVSLMTAWPGSEAGKKFKLREIMDLIKRNEPVELVDLATLEQPIRISGGTKLSFMAKLIIRMIQGPGSTGYAILEKHLFIPRRCIRYKLTDHGIVSLKSDVITEEEGIYEILSRYEKG